MRLRILGLMALGLLATATARAGEIFYGYNPGDQSLIQIIRMDENGANQTALFPPGVVNVSAAWYGDISHVNYATAFAQGRMWLCVPQPPTGSYNELNVFAKAANGQLVYRQVTSFLPDGWGFNYLVTAAPGWAVDDGFVSCQVEDPVGQVSYLIRIAVTGEEVADDNFVPVPFYDPDNPGTLNPRIEILLRVPWVNGSPAVDMSHTWNFEGTRLAYSNAAGWRVKTVGPLGTFAGSADPTRDPVLLNAGVAQEPLQWRPVAGSDQLVFYGKETTKSGTKYGIYYAYANSLTHALFLQNGLRNANLKMYTYYYQPTWSADGGTVVMRNITPISSSTAYEFICKVPAVGGTVVTLTPVNSTVLLYLYGVR